MGEPSNSAELRTLRTKGRMAGVYPSPLIWDFSKGASALGFPPFLGTLGHHGAPENSVGHGPTHRRKTVSNTIPTTPFQQQGRLPPLTDSLILTPSLTPTSWSHPQTFPQQGEDPQASHWWERVRGWANRHANPNSALESPVTWVSLSLAVCKMGMRNKDVKIHESVTVKNFAPCWCTAEAQEWAAPTSSPC